MQVVYQVRRQELTDHGRPAADPDVKAARGLACLVECFLRGGVDEVECRAALHHQRGTRMVGQDEHRGVERWIRSPPARPLVVLPGAALRSELVPSHDLRADARFPGSCQGVVDPGLPAVLAVHGTERPGLEEPGMETPLGVAERSVETLLFTSAETVRGDGEVVHPYTGHPVPPT